MISALLWMTTGTNSVLSPILAALLALAGALGMNVDTTELESAQAEQSVVASDSGQPSDGSGTTKGDTQKIPAGKLLAGGSLMEWDNAVQTGPKSIRLEFRGADLSCTTYRAEVHETEASVRVDLYFDATHPEEPSKPVDGDDCIEINRSYSIDLETEDPIGDREIMQLF